MRRALAIALTTLAAPGMALAANPYKDNDLASSPVLDKSLIAHQHRHKAQRHAAHVAAKRRARAAARRAAAQAAAAPAGQAPAGQTSAAMPGYLAAIAACESGGNPQAVGGGGIYRGAFQMTYSAWASVGGQGDPAAAPMSEQVQRAAALYAQAGPGQWPVCGR